MHTDMTHAERYRIGQLNEDGQIVCGGKTRKGHPCRNTAVKQNGRCRMHNGGALIGPASPRYKTGQWSKLLPQGKFKEAYERTLSDPDFLSLHEEIALTIGRTDDLLDEQFGAGEKAIDTLRRAKGQADIIRQAIKDEDTTAYNTAVRDLLDILRGTATPYNWPEIGRQLDRLERLKRTEHKKTVDDELMMRHDEAQTIFNFIVTKLLESVIKHVADPTIIKAIRQDASDGIRAVYGPVNG